MLKAANVYILGTKVRDYGDIFWGEFNYKN